MHDTFLNDFLFAKEKKPPEKTFWGKKEAERIKIKIITASTYNRKEKRKSPYLLKLQAGQDNDGFGRSAKKTPTHKQYKDAVVTCITAKKIEVD